MVSTFGHVDDSSFYDDAEPSWNPEYAAAFAAPERYGGYSFADDDDLDHAGIAGITDRNAVYDALPSVVRDYCSTSVFNRAQIIVAQADTKASALICRQDPEDGSVFLSGRIRGTTSPHSIYDVWLDYHAPIRRLSQFGCSCPAFRSYAYDACKHIVALAVLFARYPARFEGFGHDERTTSRDLLNYMRSMDEQQKSADNAAQGMMPNDQASDGAGQNAQLQRFTATVRPGEVGLEPTFVRDTDGWSVQFRISGNGTSYVLKDITRFVADMGSGVFERSCQKLAFSHYPPRFAPFSRHMLNRLQIMLDSRAAASRQGRYYSGDFHVERRLTLADDELVGMLDLCQGHCVGVVLDRMCRGTPYHAQVLDTDPPLAVSCEDTTRNGAEGFMLRLRNAIALQQVIIGHGTTYMLIRHDFGSGVRNAVDFAFHRCSVKFRNAQELISILGNCGSGGQFLERKDLPLFVRTLMPLLGPDGLDVLMPSAMHGMRPMPCRIGFYLDRDDRGLSCVVRARYGDDVLDVLPAATIPTHVGSRASMIIRDMSAERRAARLARCYFPSDDQRAIRITDADDDAQIRLFVDGLDELRANGDLFTTPAFERMLMRRPPVVHVGLSIKSELVECSLIADEIPANEVSAVLASYRRHQRFHRLRDGAFVDLRNADLKELDATAADLELSDEQIDSGKVQVPGYRAFQLDADVQEENKDEGFKRYVQDLRAIDPTSYQVPRSLSTVLRSYQIDGFRWLSVLCDKGFGGILADEMGLGKSVQLIALLLACRERGLAAAPSLIVCPASLVYNWAAEFAKFAPDMRIEVVAGSKAKRRAILGDVNSDGTEVLITSYDLLRRDCDLYDSLHFDCMVIDEAQYIKNQSTKMSKAVKTIEAAHRFALTGTPIENRLSELWSIFDFLMPGMLGSYKRFRTKYEQPILGGGDEGRRVAAKLRALIGVFVMRRLKSSVLRDLPDKMTSVITVRLEGEQRKLYAAHEQRLKSMLTKESDADFNTGKIRVLAELTTMRQICCDPRLLYANAKDASAKLDALWELVSNCMDAGKKMLVFSQFTSYLELIAARLDQHQVSYYTITGATSKQKRLALVDAFNADDTPVFLISLKAGNTGLNLVGASVVVHADPWWNAAAQDQATDRAHRIGQTNDVHVYQIVAKDTIEERMLKLQQSKSELVASLMQADESDGGADGAASTEGRDAKHISAATMTREDLLTLLS